MLDINPKAGLTLYTRLLAYYALLCPPPPHDTDFVTTSCSVTCETCDSAGQDSKNQRELQPVITF